MEALLKATEIQLPKALVAEKLARLAAEMKQNLRLTKAWPMLPTWICLPIV